MTDLEFTQTELITILSALGNGSPDRADRGEALHAIPRRALRFGVTVEDVLTAASGLLEGRLSPAEFREILHDLGGTEPLDEAPFVEVTDAPQAATGAQEKAPRP